MIRNYTWNIKSWLARYLPFRRRTEEPLALQWVFLAPLQDLADELADKAVVLDFQIKYSSQQKVLEGLLNRLFDPANNRIKVQTISDLVPDVVLYFDNELEPFPQVLYFDGETMAFDAPILYHDSEEEAMADYRVIVPASLSGDEAKLRAWINRYNLADKNYIIEYE
jgi:hypothetical protein